MFPIPIIVQHCLLGHWNMFFLRKANWTWGAEQQAGLPACNMEQIKALSVQGKVLGGIYACWTHERTKPRTFTQYDGWLNSSVEFSAKGRKPFFWASSASARMKTQLTTTAVLRGACIRARFWLGRKRHKRIMCSTSTGLYLVKRWTILVLRGRENV